MKTHALQYIAPRKIHPRTRLHSPAAGGQLSINVFAGEFFGGRHEVYGVGVGVIVISGSMGKLVQTA